MTPEAYRWTVRVTGGPEDGATAHARRQSFPVGAPLSFDREYPRATALEHLLAAVGADLVAGLRNAAQRRRLRIGRIEAVVEGGLANPLVHLGVVGEEGNPGLDRLVVKVFADASGAEEELRQVWREVLRRSPMVHTFRLEPELRLV